MPSNSSTVLDALNPALRQGEAERVVGQVARQLTRRFCWLSADELVQEAWQLSLDPTEDVLTSATSAGAFHQRLKGRLIDLHKTEERERSERIAVTGVLDVGDEGTVYVQSAGNTQDDTDGRRAVSIPAHGYVPSEDASLGADGRPRYVPGQRSRLIDTLAGAKTKEAFWVWAQKELGGAWGKKRDLHALLFGYGDEAFAVFAKHARANRGLHVPMPKEGGEFPQLTQEAREAAVVDDWYESSRLVSDTRAADLWAQRPLRSFPFPDRELRTSYR